MDLLDNRCPVFLDHKLVSQRRHIFAEGSPFKEVIGLRVGSVVRQGLQLAQGVLLTSFLVYFWSHGVFPLWSFSDWRFDLRASDFLDVRGVIERLFDDFFQLTDCRLNCIEDSSWLGLAVDAAVVFCLLTSFSDEMGHLSHREVVIRTGWVNLNWEFVA